MGLILLVARSNERLVGRDGVEPPESVTADLQSAPLPLTVYLPMKSPPKWRAIANKTVRMSPQTLSNEASGHSFEDGASSRT